jgi:hypothetical protein
MKEVAMDDTHAVPDFSTVLALLERLSGGFEATPARLSAFVESFCASLSDADPQWIPVIAIPGAEPGKFVKNVAAKIERSGGSVEQGWAIWENPGISISASFHAVWVSPKGELFDVTPDPHNASRILFVADRGGRAEAATRTPPGRVTWAHPALERRLREPGAREAMLRDLLANATTEAGT